jgi:hypothetical protein
VRLQALHNTKTEVGAGLEVNDVYWRPVVTVVTDLLFTGFRIKIPGYITRIRNSIMRIFGL